MCADDNKPEKSNAAIGGPAFPTPGEARDLDWRVDKGHGGMSLRDHFAAAAMQGMLASGDYLNGDDELAQDSYNTADAMIREKRRREASEA